MMSERKIAARKLADALTPPVGGEPAWQRVRTHMLCQQQPFAVACSGGADSVCALLCAWGWAEAVSCLPPVVLHVDHGVRGEDSRGDADFVRGLAEALGLEFLSRRLGFAEGESVSEAALREARLAFFAEVWRERRLGLIWTGHQRDDVVETLLMRLTRGSGLEGLAAPRPIQQGEHGLLFARPLLDTGRDALRAVLRENGLEWREDASNAEQGFLRNRVRAEVVPALEKASGRDVGAAMARSRRLLEEDAIALAAEADSLLDKALDGAGSLELAAVVKASRALRRRVLHHWLARQGLGGAFSAEGFEQLLELVESGQKCRVSAGSGCYIESNKNLLQCARDAAGLTLEGWEGQRLTPGQTVKLPDGAEMTLQEVPLNDDLKRAVGQGRFSEVEEVYFAVDAGSARWVFIRPWKPGDRYRPLNAPGRRKVGDFLTDRKVALVERVRLPAVLSEDQELIWVPGLPVAHGHRLQEDTERALRLTYRRPC